MNRLLWFLAGAATAGVALLAIGWVTIKGAKGFSASAKPGTLETMMARRVHRAAIPDEARDKANPVPDTAETLVDARAHWADHCAVCHSNDGSGDAQMGKNMYPHAPDMRKDGTQRMTDGELFFIIENGVRLTGMPAWGGAHGSSEDSWKLVRFIRHLPQLTPEEVQQMEKLNPKSPDELKEEQEEQEFLNGGKKNEAH